MNVAIVLVSLAFTAWRFATPGHAVSPAGSVEALAHVWMGVLLAVACAKRLRGCNTAAAKRTPAAASFRG